jgi:peptidoglycan/xylan/chitin deacetylase (PgdA/CDA1 family)
MVRIFKIPGFISYLFPYRIWNLSLKTNSVYLTFDDGPQPNVTNWVLDFLKSENISATFFCIGENVKQHPEIFKRIIDEGHSVGNHSMHHEIFSRDKTQEYINSIKSAAELIPSELFRPPYGNLSRKMAKHISKDYRIIMWTWMAFDFDKSVSVESIIKQSRKIKSGDILVFHDNLKSEDRLKKLLPPIVAQLKKSGFQFDAIPMNR